MNTTLINGKTGNIMLNRKGDRINAVYQIVNLRRKGDTQLAVVGEYRDGNVANISKTVLWPGGQDEKPKGVFVSTNLRVSFLETITKTVKLVPFLCSRLFTEKCVKLDNHLYIQKQQKSFKTKYSSKILATFLIELELHKVHTVH